MSSSILISDVVDRAVRSAPVVDMHTHLYPPSFGTAHGGSRADPSGLLLWGFDELLTYHYLVAEVFRAVPATRMPYEAFWKMSKVEQADHIWRELFINRSPISEACRGVITVLSRLGLDPSERDPNRYRRWFGQQDASRHIDRVMELSGVKSITMTNDVFDDAERQRWLANPDVGADPRFKAVLRIDPMLRDWPRAASCLREWGYKVDLELSDGAIAEAQRFLRDWIGRMKAIYLAVSLPPEFRFPGAPGDAVGESSSRVLEHVILPVCREFDLPFAMMIGCDRDANPALRDAKDIVGKSDVASVARLCRTFAQNRFLVTMLSREDQHELCVVARKFGNLMVFGCWWFVNVPSIIEEITSMRLELLGLSVVPQHSDARVLDQLIYKWDHSREIIGSVLTRKYQDLERAGWRSSESEIIRDVNRLFAGNFLGFLKGSPQ